MYKKLFVDHPQSVGENYFQHMAVAFGFGFQMLGGALACIIHGIVPGLFEKTGGKTIICLHERLQAKRGCGLVSQPSPIASKAETALS
jgi:Family of unknown function (DUF6356)